jgi:hypothetical protein
VVKGQDYSSKCGSMMIEDLVTQVRAAGLAPNPPVAPFEGWAIEHLREPLKLSPRWFQKNGKMHKCQMGSGICYYGLELETFVAKS